VARPKTQVSVAYRLVAFIFFSRSSSLRLKPFTTARLMPLSSVSTPATVALTMAVFLPLLPFIIILLQSLFHILLLHSLLECRRVLDFLTLDFLIHVVLKVGTAVVEKVLLFVRVSEGAVIKVGWSSGVAVWVATVGWYSGVAFWVATVGWYCGVAIWVVIVVECWRSVRFCPLGLIKLLL